MTTRELNYSFEEYSDFSKLDPQISKLIHLAKEAAQKAYAPYSKFKVGAVLELNNGEIFSGNNQENAAYPSGLCAERTVLFYANSNFPDTPVKRMVLAAYENGHLTDSPVYPCGACRQVMMETQDRYKQNYEVWMLGKEKVHMVKSVAPLLPLKFIW